MFKDSQRKGQAFQTSSQSSSAGPRPGPKRRLHPPRPQLLTHCSPGRTWRGDPSLCPAWGPRTDAALPAAPSPAGLSGPLFRPRLPRPLPGRGLDASHSARPGPHSLLALSSAPRRQAAAALLDCQAGRLHDVPPQGWRAVPETRMRSDSAPNLHLPAAATSRSLQPLRLAQLCRQR